MIDHYFGRRAHSHDARGGATTNAMKTTSANAASACRRRAAAIRIRRERDPINEGISINLELMLETLDGADEGQKNRITKRFRNCLALGSKDNKETEGDFCADGTGCTMYGSQVPN